jgi:hypothetical protein
MKRLAQWSPMVVLALFASMLVWTPVRAQDASAVAGLIVHFGVVPAEVALGASGHADAHPAHPPAGSQHLLITLDDARTGKRIGDAEVAIEVTGPRGYAEKKHLLHTQAGGLPDYSELFVLPASGKYSVHVIIRQASSAKAIETRFVINHVV